MQLDPHREKQLTPQEQRLNKMVAYCYISVGINAAMAFILMGMSDYLVMVMSLAAFFSAYTGANSERGGKTAFVLAIIVSVLCTLMLSFWWGYNLYIALLPASALELGGAFIAWRRFSANIKK